MAPPRVSPGNARIENVGKYQSCMVSKFTYLLLQARDLRFKRADGALCQLQRGGEPLNLLWHPLRLLLLRLRLVLVRCVAIGVAVIVVIGGAVFVARQEGVRIKTALQPLLRWHNLETMHD